MASIKIDGVDYDSETLPADCKQHLEMLIFTEQKLRQLQTELAIIQTARQSYASALKAALPAVSRPSDGYFGLGETIA